MRVYMYAYVLPCHTYLTRECHFLQDATQVLWPLLPRRTNYQADFFGMDACVCARMHAYYHVIHMSHVHRDGGIQPSLRRTNHRADFFDNFAVCVHVCILSESYICHVYIEKKKGDLQAGATHVR